MSDVPILSAPRPTIQNREYAAWLTTADCGEHLVCVAFPVPAGQDGAVDLGAVQAFNPEAQLLANLKLQIAFALRLPVRYPEGFTPDLMFAAEGGAHVVPAHVVSFRYLGPVESRDPDAQVLRVRQAVGGGRTGIVKYSYGYGELYPRVGTAEAA